MKSNIRTAKVNTAENPEKQLLKHSRKGKGMPSSAVIADTQEKTAKMRAKICKTRAFVMLRRIMSTCLVRIEDNGKPPKI